MRFVFILFCYKEKKKQDDVLDSDCQGLEQITEGEQKSLFGGGIRSKNQVTRKSSHTKGLGRERILQAEEEQVQRPMRAVL